MNQCRGILQEIEVYIQGTGPLSEHVRTHAVNAPQGPPALAIHVDEGP